MSEHQSPQNQFEPQPISPLRAEHLGSLTGVSHLLGSDTSQQTVLPVTEATADVWEDADLLPTETVAATGEGFLKEIAEEGIAEEMEPHNLETEASGNAISDYTPAVIYSEPAEKSPETLPETLPERSPEQSADNSVLSPTDSGASGASPTDASPTDASPTDASPTDASPTDASPTDRERELLTLIHDLNDCNDALLAQVSKLEGDLQRANSAAAAEVDKAKAAVQLAQEKMNRQISAEQASAQQISQTAQQQVARLVGELDVTEQTLSRQKLMNENLQTELSEAQSQIAQLEKECALAAQKHAEEVQAKVQAQNRSRDLRSRLQRQQRYTLQFKAALEKSLSVGSSASMSSESQNVHTVSFNQPAAVSMPRSQRIMPWAAGGNYSAFQGIDPHLEALIRRGAKRDVPEPVQPAPAAKHEVVAAPVSPEPVSPEAEAELWQDLARVMTHETEDVLEPVEAPEVKAPEVKALESTAEDVPELVAPDVTAEQVRAPETTIEMPSETLEDEAEADVSEAIAKKQVPHLNWQSASAATATAMDAAVASIAVEDTSDTTVGVTVEADCESKADCDAETDREANADYESEPTDGLDDVEKDAEQAVNVNNTALAEALAKAKRQARRDRESLDTAVYTEPSPWGKPLKLPTPTQSPAAANYLPAVEGGATSTVSPVAQPLRAQKKIGSLSSVELPTFPSAKSESFKR